MRALPKVVAAVLVAWALVSGVESYLARRDLGRVSRAFEATPGFLLSEAELEGGTVVISGLIDPLVRTPKRIADAALGSSERDVEFRLRSYSSLDEAIVVRRIRQLVTLPDGVGLEVQRGDLFLIGLDHAVCEQAAELVRELPLQLLGVESVIVLR